MALTATVISSTAKVRAQPQPTPLVRAHAHNGPLFDALDRGFMSVEVDVFLVNNQLLVGHDPTQLRPDRTLQSLYLDPLQQRVRQNQGQVYHKGGLEFTLLIDVKTEPVTTYLALRDVLKQYQDILTLFTPTTRKQGAVMAIVSGNRAREVMAGEATRYAGMDGRLPDLNSDASTSLIPLISDSWAGPTTLPGGVRVRFHRQNVRSSGRLSVLPMPKDDGFGFTPHQTTCPCGANY